MIVCSQLVQSRTNMLTCKPSNSGAYQAFRCPGVHLNRLGRGRRCAVQTRAEKKQDQSRLQELGQKASGAVSKAADAVKDVFTDDNVLEYCSLDQKGGRRMTRVSLGEKEQEFLGALSSFYFDGKSTMSNEEFDNLKEELLWEGSRVAVLSETEQKFLQVSMAAQAGKSIMSDEEYDELKRKLRNKNSKVVQQGPRCSIRSRNLYSDCNPDYLKMVALNLPAAIVILAALFSIDDLTGFQITNLVELPEPYGIIFLWGAVFPALFIFVASITNFIFKDNLILKGDCPNCNTGTSTYFGDILTVKGNREKNDVKCGDCGAMLHFDSSKRQIKVDKFPEEANKKPAAGAKKKGAAAGSKKQSASAGSKKQGSDSKSDSDSGENKEKKESPKPQAA